MDSISQLAAAGSDSLPSPEMNGERSALIDLRGVPAEAGFGQESGVSCGSAPASHPWGAGSPSPGGATSTVMVGADVGQEAGGCSPGEGEMGGIWEQGG